MMARLEDHPTALAVRRQTRPARAEGPVDAAWLRQLCLDTGADDVGFVAIERPELADERKYIQALFPQTRALISFVCRMNREPVRRVQLCGESRVPPGWGRGERRGAPNRRGPRICGCESGEPSNGVSDGGRPLAGANVGRVPQTRGSGRRTGHDGYSPQRHSPAVWELHPARHRVDRISGLGILRADAL